MPMYQRLGDVPRKRHIQFRDNGTLLTEEVMGLEGFTGNESILYHLHSPCRVMELAGFEPIERDEWVPDQHAHRHFHTYETAPEGDEVTGRRLLMWNDDVERVVVEDVSLVAAPHAHLDLELATVAMRPELGRRVDVAVVVRRMLEQLPVLVAVAPRDLDLPR